MQTNESLWGTPRGFVFALVLIQAVNRVSRHQERWFSELTSRGSTIPAHSRAVNLVQLGLGCCSRPWSSKAVLSDRGALNFRNSEVRVVDQSKTQRCAFGFGALLVVLKSAIPALLTGHEKPAYNDRTEQGHPAACASNYSLMTDFVDAGWRGWWRVSQIYRAMNLKTLQATKS